MRDSNGPVPGVTSSDQRFDVLGAILAGGLSRRFGSTKALASIGERALVQRVASVVGAVASHPVLITGDPAVAALLPLPSRGDVVAGLGPLGGLHAALLWARELGLPGSLCVACDLPFLAPPLLRTIAARGLDAGVAVVPESRSRRGFEPLAAWYPVSAIPEIEGAMESGHTSMHLLCGVLPSQRIPLPEVSSYGDPDVMFMNVNTPEAAQAAEAIAHGEAHDV